MENYGYLRLVLAEEGRGKWIARITELGAAIALRKEEDRRPPALATLTDREYEIVGLMDQRLSNREIAEKLYLSEGSVKQYVNQIYSKLHIEGDTRTKRKQLSGLLRQKA